MYEEITEKIKITVKPELLDEHSDPDEKRFIWAYHIKIENVGSETVQLLSRSWKITDSLGRVQEVSGAGVVGEQPILHPGEKYEYTSGAPLSTPSGFMEGYYEMETKDGNKFDASIPLFSSFQIDQFVEKYNPLSHRFQKLPAILTVYFYLCNLALNYLLLKELFSQLEIFVLMLYSFFHPLPNKQLHCYYLVGL